MSKRLRKSACVMAFTMALGVVLGACQTFSDLIPEEYGAWENHYIYRGNVRSKTTGDDAETLVETLRHDNVTYSVNQCNDYAIVGNDIYMCLSTYQNGSTSWESVNALVRYNVQEKTQTALQFKSEFTDLDGVTWEYEPYTVEKVFDDEVLLYGNRRVVTTVENGEVAFGNYHNLYYTVDLDGNIKEAESFNYTGWERVGEDYWLKAEYGEEEYEFRYLTWGMTEPITICEGIQKSVQFVEKNGVKGFLVATTTIDEVEADGARISALDFFDVKTNTTTSLWQGNDAKWVEVPEYEYFMDSKNMTVNYTEREGLLKKETKTARIQGNCELYRIVYSQDRVAVEKVYTFDKEKDFSRISGVGNGKCYVNAIWYSSASGCQGGGYNREYYALDMQTKTLKKLNTAEDFQEKKDDCYTENALNADGVVCGDYLYYIHREQYSNGFMSGRSTAYLLKRYQTSTKTLEVMQLWSGSSYSITGEKACAQMWKQGGGSVDDFIVRTY